MRMHGTLDKIAVLIKTPEVPVEPPLALLSGSFEERLWKAASYGYRGVELVTSDPSQLDASWMTEALKRNGLCAAAIATGCVASARSLTLISPDPLTRGSAVSLLISMIRFAGAIGAPIVTLGSFRGKAASVGNNMETALEQLDEALQPADEEASSNGVMIALEPINTLETDLLNTSNETARYIRSRGFRNIGILLDTYHMELEKEDISQAISRHADLLCHVHIADTNRFPVGKGQVGFFQLEKSLEAASYGLWQSAELSRGNDPDGNAEITIKNLIRIQSTIH